MHEMLDFNEFKEIYEKCKIDKKYINNYTFKSEDDIKMVELALMTYHNRNNGAYKRKYVARTDFIVYIPTALGLNGYLGYQVPIEYFDIFECEDTTIKDILKDLYNIEDIGDFSDGYHTFNQLYYQRMILFATIVKQNKDKAWKSYKHEDGKYCFDKDGEWFIVGVDTLEGPYTYHYESQYWNLFDCEELEIAKHWDGHTEKDVTRLLSL